LDHRNALELWTIPFVRVRCICLALSGRTIRRSTISASRSIPPSTVEVNPESRRSGAAGHDSGRRYRKLPLEAAPFDAIVNLYAIDHLNCAGVEQSLAEAARVLRPGGEFL